MANGGHSELTVSMPTRCCSAHNYTENYWIVDSVLPRWEISLQHRDGGLAAGGSILQRLLMTCKLSWKKIDEL
eukprot:scaffold7295_cov167-Amphora_coffeaeformis.AAC.8